MMRRGFSLPELLIVASIFSVFLMATYIFLDSGLAVWERTASSQDVSFQLQKAKSDLGRELSQAKFSKSALAESYSPGLESSQGDVLWFLSAYDSKSQRAVRRPNGSAFWQRNILYYLKVPNQHDKFFDTACSGHYKTCPHKVLVRKVIDSGPVTSPSSSLVNEEALLFAGSIAGFLTAPDGFSFPSQGPSVESAEIVATGLLSFRLTASPKEGTQKEYAIKLAGFDVEKAGRKLHFNKEDIFQSPYTHFIDFSVFPGN